MSISEVIKKFLLFTKLTTKEAHEWLFLCSNAVNYLLGRLKTKDLKKGDAERLNAAAAMLAYCSYMQYVDSTENVKFSAGDLSVETKSATESSKKLWEEEEERISDLLKPKEEFAFFAFK